MPAQHLQQRRSTAGQNTTKNCSAVQQHLAYACKKMLFTMQRHAVAAGLCAVAVHMLSTLAKGSFDSFKTSKLRKQHTVPGKAHLCMVGSLNPRQ